jgi:autotransporter-associated beta strand protein
MKRNLQHPSAPAVLAAGGLIALSLGLAQPIMAASETWTGGAASDNWSDANNWGGTGPAGGDWIFFDGGVRLTPNNDLPAGTIFGSLLFNSGPSSFTLGGNSLTLTNGLDAGAGLTAGGGLTNASPNSQTVGLGLTLSSGKHVIEADGGGQLTLSGAVSRNAGATVVFSSVSGGINVNGSGLANLNGILGGWATMGNDWAALDGSFNLTPYAAYTAVGSGALPNGATLNVKYAADTANLTSANGTAINSLVAEHGAARTLTLTGVLRLGAKGGILRDSSATGGFTVTGGNLTTAGSGGEITLGDQPYSATGNNLTVNSVITNDTGNLPVSVNIIGYVAMSAANTYSGGTYINQGRVQAGNAAVFGTGPVYVAPGSEAFLNTGSTFANNFFLGGVGATENSGGQQLGALRFGASAIASGTITLLANARVSGASGSANTISGRITGPGRLELTAATGSIGSMTLSNPLNDWNGGLLITVGNASRSVYMKLGANNVIPDGPGKADVTLNATTTGEARFDLNGFSETINGLVAAASAYNEVSNTAAAASTLTFGGNNATATFSGSMGDNAAGPLSLVKIGTGTQTFSGTSSCRGGVTVSGGSLVFGATAWSAATAAITVNSNATLDVSAVSAGSLGVSQSLTASNGTLALAVQVGAPTLATTNLNALGATNYLVVTDIGPISGYPVQLVALRGTNVTGTLNFGLGSPLPPSPGIPYSGYVSNNVANNSVDLYLTAGPVQLKWAGYSSGTPNSAWDLITPNWRTAAGASVPYVDGDFVVLDDSASNSLVTLAQNVAPAGITVSNNVLNYTINDVASPYAMGGDYLAKKGTGTLILDNNGANTFGSVTISAGTLQVGNNDVSGNLPADVPLVNNGLLAFQRTDAVAVSNVISGTGALIVRSGTGASSEVVTLYAANTFTGAVTVAQGTLQAGNVAALGTTNGGTTVSSGATLDVNGFNLGAELVTVSGTGVGGNGAIINSGAADFPALRLVTLAGNTALGGPGAGGTGGGLQGRWDIRYSASGATDPALSRLSTGGNAYTLTKVGPNYVGLCNVTVDPALANVDIQAGTLSLQYNVTSMGNPANTLTIEAGAYLDLYNLTNLLNKPIVMADTANINVTAGANTITGPVTLNGTGFFIIGGTSLALNGALGGPGILSKGGNSPLIINGNASGLTNGVSVTVGTLTLNGVVGGGLTNAAATTLTGTGTNNGLVDMNGTVFPGGSNAVGTLTVGGLILESGAAAGFDLNYDTTPGNGSNDLIVVNGDLTINGNTITINPLTLLRKGIPYRLFNYTGSLIWNANLTVNDAVGYTYAVNTNTPGQINLIASGGPPVWDGGSATTSNWSDAANWGGISIGAGNYLWFAGRNRLINNNDTSPGTVYNSLDFYTDAGNFVLNGNPIGLSGNIINESTNLQTIELGLSLGPTNTFNGATASLVIGGSITNASSLGTLTLSGNGLLTNLLYCADPTSMTNILVTSSNANWTLLDNPTATAITDPIQLDIQAGTFSFGQGSSAPNLNSIASDNNSRLGVIGGAPATFNMVNGTLTIAARLNTGSAANTIATLNQSGGTLNLLSIFQCSDGSSSAYTAVNATGGSLIVGTPTAGNNFYLASRGTGVVTVANSALIQCGTFDVSRNAAGNTLGSVGVVNLNGGTLQATRVGTATGSAQAGGTPTATFNFNGGTLKARASSATFYQGSAASPACPITSIVKLGGAIIDSDTNAISILEPLQHDSLLGTALDGGLTKLGAGTLTLTAVNTYTGPTLVSAGTLAINGSLVANDAVTVNAGGTLGGTGTCGGNVTVNSGGTLSPGNSIGTLTVWSNVTLQAGSITRMEITHGPAATNDVVRCTGGTISLGGTLVVTNIGPTLQSGDAFTLFSGTLSGSISPALPPLWPGLSWNTSSLNSLGRISVTGTLVPPRIGSLSVAGGFVTLGGSNGLAGATYYVVASTNVALPLSSWAAVATNTFDINGNFNISIAIDPAVPDSFYRIQAP